MTSVIHALERLSVHCATLVDLYQGSWKEGRSETQVQHGLNAFQLRAEMWISYKSQQTRPSWYSLSLLLSFMFCFLSRRVSVTFLLPKKTQRTNGWTVVIWSENVGRRNFMTHTCACRAGQVNPETWNMCTHPDKLFQLISSLGSDITEKSFSFFTIITGAVCVSCREATLFLNKQLTLEGVDCVNQAKWISAARRRSARLHLLIIQVNDIKYMLGTLTEYKE